MKPNTGMTTNNDRILRLEAEVATMRAEQADLLGKQAQLDSALQDIRTALLESQQKVGR